MNNANRSLYLLLKAGPSSTSVVNAPSAMLLKVDKALETKLQSFHDLYSQGIRRIHLDVLTRVTNVYLPGDRPAVNLPHAHSPELVFLRPGGHLQLVAVGSDAQGEDAEDYGIETGFFAEALVSKLLCGIYPATRQTEQFVLYAPDDERLIAAAMEQLSHMHAA